MAPKTLYDIVRPICWRLNMIGYNYGNEKSAGWMRRGYKWLVKCMLMYAMWKKLIYECLWINTYTATSLAVVIFDSLLISNFCLQLFFVKEREMEEMMKRMKQHPVGKMSQKNLKKQLIPFKIYTVLFVIIFLYFTSIAFFSSINNFQQGKMSLSWAIFVFVQMGYYLFIQQFPFLICILPCITACYCRAEMDEAMVEMKRIKSPLRRVKAGAKLMEKYQQLYELASVTDVGLSTAMYFMKWILFIAFAAILLVNTMIFYQTVNEDPIIDIVRYCISLFLNSLIVMYFPLFQYFYLAPSANQMFELMNKAIVHCGSMDDQWLSHDPITRPYLLKMRMEQVEGVSHMATDDPPFTLFGDVLSKDILSAIVLELIDLCNTLGVHEIEEEMKLSRIYYDFMRRCIDCEYWYQYQHTANY